MPKLIRGRYEPLDVVGQGGQGEVVRALDHVHDRQVALKVRRVGSVSERERLLGEARILLNLRPHPGVTLAREDFFSGGRYYYLVMDWVEGKDLRRVLEERGDPGLPLDEVCAYLRQVADALDHLHAHDPPIVHQDVKPANIILTPEGRVVLVDFGISSDRSSDGQTAGTRGYIAPEVAAGGRPTPAADVYALGATAYALLTGAPPRPGERPRLPRLGRRTERRILGAIRRAMSMSPANRYETAGAFVTDVGVKNHEDKARKLRARGGALRTVPVLAAGFVLVASALATAALGPLRPPGPETPAPNPAPDVTPTPPARQTASGGVAQNTSAPATPAATPGPTGVPQCAMLDANLPSARENVRSGHYVEEAEYAMSFTYDPQRAERPVQTKTVIGMDPRPPLLVKTTASTPYEQNEQGDTVVVEGVQASVYLENLTTCEARFPEGLVVSVRFARPGSSTEERFEFGDSMTTLAPGDQHELREVVELEPGEYLFLASVEVEVAPQ